MPAHPRTFERLNRELTAATTVERCDEILDTILDYRQNATEWDADQWGLTAPDDHTDK
jgi:hypothetical protein